MDASRSDAARFARSGAPGVPAAGYPELFWFLTFSAVAPPLGRM